MFVAIPLLSSTSTSTSSRLELNFAASAPIIPVRHKP